MSGDQPGDRAGGQAGGGSGQGGASFSIPALGELLNDAPLLREIQRVMLSSTGPVNWELARQIGVAMASWGQDDAPPAEADRTGLAEAVRAAELAVSDLTGLTAPVEVSRVEAVRRAQWVDANTRSLREVLDPVAARITAAMSGMSGAIPGGGWGPGAAGGTDPTGPQGAPGAEMLQAMLNQMAPLLLGAQVGSVLGSLGQRVFGHFDLAVPRGDTTIAFVIPNVTRFERDWSLEPMEFRLWVAVHEVTHLFEFARTWVRPHFLALITDLVEHAEIDLAGLQVQLEGFDVGNPDALTEALEGVGNLFGQAGTTEQRLRLARVQAFLVAAETYADHVEDVLGRRMLSTSQQIGEAITRHREGRPADQALERLLGLEMNPELYEHGRRFCRQVVEQAGETTLARIWEAPEALPAMPELEEPTLWLSRTA